LIQANQPLNSKYLIIDNIFIFYNLVEHYISPILQKEAIKIVVKAQDYFLNSKSRKFAKEAPYIYCQDFMKFF
jgi:hypothetical protein